MYDLENQDSDEMRGFCELYIVAWDTLGKSSDDVDVSMRVNYVQTDEFFSRGTM